MTGINEAQDVSTAAAIAAETWLSRQELATRWSVSAKTLAEWASKGTGPRYYRFGKHVRYRLSDAIAWENGRAVERD